MNITKLSLTFLISFFIGVAKADNNLAELMNIGKLVVGPIAYGVSNQVLTRNVGDSDLRATIDASIGLAANSIKNKLTDEKNESNNDKISGILNEAIKPWIILGTIRFGLPFLNKLFEYIHMPQMAKNDYVSAITAQKIVLFYVGVSQALGLIKFDKKNNKSK